MHKKKVLKPVTSGRARGRDGAELSAMQQGGGQLGGVEEQQVTMPLP